jgi:hypothetical protein
MILAKAAPIPLIFAAFAKSLAISYPSRILSRADSAQQRAEIPPQTAAKKLRWSAYVMFLTCNGRHLACPLNAIAASSAAWILLGIFLYLPSTFAACRRMRPAVRAGVSPTSFQTLCDQAMMSAAAEAVGAAITSSSSTRTSVHQTAPHPHRPARRSRAGRSAWFGRA